VGALAAVAAGGCIGTTDREAFNRVIQDRGGGFTSDLPLEAVDAVAAEVGEDDFELRTMSVTPSSETVVMEVRDPAAPENLDQYVVRRGDVDSVEPVRLGASDDLDQQTFPVSSLALDRIERMADAALAEFDAEGYVTSLSASQVAEGEITFHVALESPRSRASATFTAEGELIEVTRT
jgi:hypothetical protein